MLQASESVSMNVAKVKPIFLSKLFTKDYPDLVNYVKEQFIKTKRNTTLLNEVSIEALFCYLKDGLQINQETFKFRYTQIERTSLKKLLSCPLLLIFTDEEFVSVKDKTADLYVTIYNKLIEHPKLDFEKFSQLLNSHSTTTSLFFEMKRFEEHKLKWTELIYKFLATDCANKTFFKKMQSIVQAAPMFIDGLFGEFNSHFVDFVFNLCDDNTCIFMDAILKSGNTSALEYLVNYKFNNGISALSWLRGYLIVVKKIDPVFYRVGALKDVGYVLKAFEKPLDLSNPVFQAMFEETENQSQDVSEESESRIKKHKSNPISTVQTMDDEYPPEITLASILNGIAKGEPNLNESKIPPMPFLSSLGYPDDKFSSKKFISDSQVVNYFAKEQKPESGIAFFGRAKNLVPTCDLKPLEGLCIDMIQDKLVQVNYCDLDEKSLNHCPDFSKLYGS